MGCCVSSNRASNSSASSLRKDHDLAVVAQPPKASESKAPPQVGEETVKEVLSETPRWKPTKPEKPLQNMAFDKFVEDKKVEKKALPINKAEEISEVSEVCSLSETMSTITDQIGEGEETRKRVTRSLPKMQKNRCFSGDLGCKRERTVHGPMNVGSVRLVQCRDQKGQKMDNGGMRNQHRRGDPSENFFRRARSPAATRADNVAARSIVCRSPSVRRTNRSHARVRTDSPENGCRKMESPTMEGKWSSARESLENPLVSLECFIFI